MKKHSIHSVLIIKPYLHNPPADGLVTGRVLGRGSFCVVKEVLLLTDTPGSGSEYALKELRRDLSPEGREHAQASLVNEIKILQNVRHPNIVQIR